MGTRWGICSAGNISHGFVVALKTPSPEDHQALRTHFFVSVEVKELLSHGDVGEVRMVRADLVTPLTHIPRLVEKELGGGALLDIGVYCVQFVLMVYRGERPESIQATGYKLDAGVQ
ncbi:trans-1,2-dihydrobenzene-1,2-diol dehydrogenase-like isoform X2 [Pygocentrus nattereri]|uniref:trans-1,2-dihydrobenzene-1,2-diol dehydrogenase-like isoform X2 n=1 Tax=Pygocentrus nattereri TaxID=42514 RepID=UPI0018911F31|nr:trans-1,2-dihydrobenzene-1,2-diol dehydrogenase-like isoform X2 [Pygocentrus nattereri]